MTLKSWKAVLDAHKEEIERLIDDDLAVDIWLFRMGLS